MQLQLPLETRTIYPAPTPKHAPVLAFVVQKHWASSLHYDLRLRIGGSMMSWAVKPGPSLDPEEKRTAIETEPHQLHHWNLQTNIEFGQPGAGPILMWDRGTYSLKGLEDAEAATVYELAEKALEAGKFTFCLHGHKLRGAFSLGWQRTHHGHTEWTLQKLPDTFATTEDILLRERSIIEPYITIYDMLPYWKRRQLNLTA